MHNAPHSKSLVILHPGLTKFNSLTSYIPYCNWTDRIVTEKVIQEIRQAKNANNEAFTIVLSLLLYAFFMNTRFWMFGNELYLPETPFGNLKSHLKDDDSIVLSLKLQLHRDEVVVLSLKKHPHEDFCPFLNLKLPWTQYVYAISTLKRHQSHPFGVFLSLKKAR